ncbi:hypothetical protein [Leptospira terpstrae]|nr:hypothetical protein [Leptospira terpstrae]
MNKGLLHMLKIYILLLTTLSLNCMSWGSYKTIDLNQRIIVDDDIPVEGRSCSFLGIPFFPAMDWAIEDALSKVQNKKGIKNAVFTDEFFIIVRCISVKGFASNSEN